jgi:NitT/TauT family transport system permease protein
MRRLQPAALPLAAAALALAAWALAVKLSGTKVFPSPLAVARAIGELASGGLLLPYLGDSLARVAAGFGLGVLCALPLGLALGLSPAALAVANPLLQAFRPISPIAWTPLAIVFFGVGNAATVFLIFLASFFPAALATVSAVHNVPEIYRRAARNFGLSRGALFFRVLLPAALPEVLFGLRIGLGVAWVVVVAAEMIAVDSGLGYLIVDARNAGMRYGRVVAGMVLIGLTGLALDAAMRAAERLPWVRWGFREQ